MNRHDLTDMQWERLEPLLPPQKPSASGRPNLNHRIAFHGLLWIARTGAPWRELPECYGIWSSVASPFYRWQRAGIWQRELEAPQQRADGEGRIDWEVHFVDGTIVRAHQHAAGAKGSDQVTEALGRRQGGSGTKVHLRAEGGGKPLTFVLTPGERHESAVFERLLEQVAVKRLGPGRHHSEAVLMEKQSSVCLLRQDLEMSCRHGYRSSMANTNPFSVTARDLVLGLQKMQFSGGEYSEKCESRWCPCHPWSDTC